VGLSATLKFSLVKFTATQINRFSLVLNIYPIGESASFSYNYGPLLIGFNRKEGHRKEGHGKTNINFRTVL